MPDNICVFPLFFSLNEFSLLTLFDHTQVFLGHSGGLDTEGNELPRLVYVSREKRPGFQHHKKAGAMNALVSSYILQSSKLSTSFHMLVLMAALSTP